MNNTLKIAAALPLCAALAACGGGGAGAQGQTGHKTDLSQGFSEAGSQRLADGVWLGKDALGKDAFALIAEDALPHRKSRTQFFIAVSSGQDNYAPFFSGDLKLQNGVIGGATVFDTFGTAELGMRGRVDAANSLSGEVLLGGAGTSSKYDFTYSRDYNSPSDLSKLVGYYSEAARYTKGIEVQISSTATSLKIDSFGVLTGSIRGCKVNGMFTLRDNTKNLYDLTLNSQPNTDHCATGKQNVVLNGLATLTRLPYDRYQSLVFAAKSTIPGSESVMLAGSTPKQQ